MLDELVDQLRKTAGGESSEDEQNKSRTPARPRQRRTSTDAAPSGEVITDVINRLREIASDQNLFVEGEILSHVPTAEEQLWKDADAPAEVAAPGAAAVVGEAPDVREPEKQTSSSEHIPSDKTPGETTQEDIPPMIALQEA